MKPLSLTTLLILGTASITLAAPKPQVKLEISTTYQKFGDGSAVASLADKGHHFAAASDELTHDDKRNIVAIYKLGRPERTSFLDLTDFLEKPRGDKRAEQKPADKDDREADLESAARVGRRIYWIASHSRTSADPAKGEKAELRPARWRFFATDIKQDTLEAVGHPYAGLFEDLQHAHPALAEAERLNKGPKYGGISIEGLAVGQNGDLWIGFRSPLVQNNALIVPLTNPEKVIGGARAKLGHPFTLNLGGRGIRDFQRVHKGLWYILAGNVDSTSNFALYGWTGEPASPPKLLANLTAEFQKAGLPDWGPEGLMVLKNGDIYLMSDDGDVKVGDNQKKNKKQDDKNRRFRSMVVRLK